MDVWYLNTRAKMGLIGLLLILLHKTEQQNDECKQTKKSQ